MGFAAVSNTPTGSRYLFIIPLAVNHYLFTRPYSFLTGFPPVHELPLSLGLFAARSLTKSLFPSSTPPTLDGFFDNVLLHLPYYLARRRHLRRSSRVCPHRRFRWEDRVWVES